MKRLLFMLAFIAMTGLMKAQPDAGTFSIIPRVGVSVTSLSGYTMKFDFSNDTRKAQFNPGYMAGLDFQYQFTKDLAASAGAFYALQGTKFKDIESLKTDQDTTYFSGAHDNHINLGYVNVPLLIHWYVYQGLSLESGVQVGFRVNAKSHYTYTEYTEKKDDQTGKIERSYAKDADGNLLKDHKYTTDVKNQFKSTDFSIPIGISYESMNVVLDARYNVGLLNVFKSDGHRRNEVFLFSAGYKFNL